MRTSRVASKGPREALRDLLLGPAELRDEAAFARQWLFGLPATERGVSPTEGTHAALRESGNRGHVEDPGEKKKNTEARYAVPP